MWCAIATVVAAQQHISATGELCKRGLQQSKNAATANLCGGHGDKAFSYRENDDLSGKQRLARREVGRAYAEKHGMRHWVQSIG